MVERKRKIRKMNEGKEEEFGCESYNAEQEEVSFTRGG